MGLFSKTPEQKEAADNYKQAKRALDANRDREETDEYLRLNQAVIDAENARKAARR